MKVGAPVNLEVQAADGRTDLYARGTVVLGPALVTEIDLPHVGSGIYRAQWTPLAPGVYSAAAQLFLDPARTTDAGYDVASSQVDATVDGSPTVYYPGDTVHLDVLAADAATGLFCTATLYLNGYRVAAVDLPEVASGFYGADWRPAAAGTYSVDVAFYLDAARNVSAGYSPTSAMLIVAQPRPTQAASTEAPAELPDEPAKLDPVAAALGIYQPDVVLRTAISEGIRRLRADPAELDAVLAWLPADELVGPTYAGEVDRLREMVCTMDVPVVAEHRLTGTEVVVVSVSDQDAQEAELTLGDLHYVTSQDDANGPPYLAGPFGASYDPQAGTVTLPDDVASAYPLQAGMQVVDDLGVAHDVGEVYDDATAAVTPVTATTFFKARLRWAGARRTDPLESESVRETLRVGCHAGDPARLVWLHSLVRYVLLRWKEELLEARGFTRTVTGSGPPTRDARFSGQEFYTRYVTVTGYARDIWRKAAHDRIASTAAVLAVKPSTPGDEQLEVIGAGQ